MSTASEIVPVLFIIFNKVDATQRVFNRIKAYKPQQLFVAADGPREHVPDERTTCEAVRAWVLGQIDWPCEVHTLFRAENRGCGRGPAEAIDWFFGQVEQGIILEDDCLPDPTFFTFCDVLLEKYRDNKAISAISGNNFQPMPPTPGPTDYYFSLFPSSWGWASWRRAWTGTDLTLQRWGSPKTDQILRASFRNEPAYRWWKQRFDWMKATQPDDMWDFQFHYHSMMNQQLAVIPHVNLVSNIGHGAQGTHFQDPTSQLANLPTYSLSFPLRHPMSISRNYEADAYVQKMLFGEVDVAGPYKQFRRLVKRTLRKLHVLP